LIHFAVTNAGFLERVFNASTPSLGQFPTSFPIHPRKLLFRNATMPATLLVDDVLEEFPAFVYEER
jgi:hypothetical protein